MCKIKNLNESGTKTAIKSVIEKDYGGAAIAQEQIAETIKVDAKWQTSGQFAETTPLARRCSSASAEKYSSHQRTVFAKIPLHHPWENMQNKKRRP